MSSHVYIRPPTPGCYGSSFIFALLSEPRRRDFFGRGRGSRTPPPAESCPIRGPERGQAKPSEPRRRDFRGRALPYPGVGGKWDGRARSTPVVLRHGTTGGKLAPCVESGHPGGSPSAGDLYGGDTRAAGYQVTRHAYPAGVTRERTGEPGGRGHSGEAAGTCAGRTRRSAAAASFPRYCTAPSPS